MEASAAGLAAGGEAAQQDGGGAPGAGQQGLAQGQDAGAGQQTVDFGALQQQLQDMSGTQEEMRQFLAAQAQAAQAQQLQQQQQAQANQPPDLSFLESEADPNVAAQRLQEVINQTADQRVQSMLEQRLGPMDQQLSDMRLNYEADQLVSEFPDLADEQVSGAVMEAAGQAATHMGQPELVANPQFVRMVYMAGRAAQMAQQQDGAAGAPGVATLEGGGGAGPAGGTQSGETSDSIGEKWAQRSGSVLPRW